MSPELIDGLLQALVGEAQALGAESLTLAIEPTADGMRQECCALSRRGDEVRHRRRLDWRIFATLGRRAMLAASLDPWQFRRGQAGRAAGRWDVSAEGANLQQRRVTLTPLGRQPAAPGSADELERQLVAQLVEPQTDPSTVATAEDPPLVKLVNLMFKDAHHACAHRITASIAGAEMGYQDGTSELRIAWPAALWPQLRGRIMHMAAFEPWQRGPAIQFLNLRFGGGDEASWTVELPEGDERLLLQLVGVRPATKAATQPQPKPRTPELPAVLRAVLEAPEDLSRRLAYADWLLERGDPRGRFLSLQLAGRAGDGPPPPEAAGWCGALGELPSEHWRFSAGFIDRVYVAGSHREWGALFSDPHWATVRALKLGHLRDLTAAHLAGARLSSLEALALAAPVPIDARSLARLTALSVSGMSERTTRFLEAAELPKLESLELVFETLIDEAPEHIAEQLVRFFSLRVARAVPDLIVDRLFYPALWPLLGTLPPEVERVTLPFVPERPRTPFAHGLVCTLQRAAPGGPFCEAVIHAEADALYREADDVLQALAGLRSLEVVRLVSEPLALDRGRLGVLRKRCATLLPRVRVEASAGPRPVRLWWLAETPPRTTS